MGLGDCKSCAVYKAQVEHLQRLLDQTLALIAPKTSEPVEEQEPVIEKEVVTYGDA